MPCHDRFIAIWLMQNDCRVNFQPQGKVRREPKNNQAKMIRPTAVLRMNARVAEILRVVPLRVAPSDLYQSDRQSMNEQERKGKERRFNARLILSRLQSTKGSLSVWE